MKQSRRVVPIILLAALAVVIVVSMTLAQHAAAQVAYFPETGHSVREPFLAFFEAQGGVAFFGYPLTEAYIDPNGTAVQVFQRARLRLTPRGVELTPIGDALWLAEPPISRADAPVGSRYVSRTGHAIAEELLSFYDDRGGQDFFGAPISEARTENNALVQDFECARLIRNEFGDYELGMLGSAYMDVNPPPPGTTVQAAPPRAPVEPPELHAYVSVQHPTVEHEGRQTIFLVVHDEDGHPVANAQSLAVLRYNDANAEIELPPTGPQGIASATFIVPPAPPGTQVVIELFVLVGNTFLTVQTTYIQWW
jgi:hypothetical protein